MVYVSLIGVNIGFITCFLLPLQCPVSLVLPPKQPRVETSPADMWTIVILQQSNVSSVLAHALLPLAPSLGPLLVESELHLTIEGVLSVMGLNHALIICFVLENEVH